MFIPAPKYPVKSKDNPKGTLHINKTEQDKQPVELRKRYQDWLKRQKG